ncbi:MAG: hypothetical protein [Bacteriophage sp.]|nr:MAG: hypothetical protein [Bacteriophage sp.]
MKRTSMITMFAALSAVAMNAQAEGGEGAAPAPVLTLAEKLTAKAKALFELVNAKTAEYHDVVAQLTAIELVANVAAGDTVNGSTGIGAKKQLVSGVVLGVSEDEKGKLIKVQSGQGFDTTVFTMRAAQISSVVPAGTVELETQASDEVVEQPAETPAFDAEPAAE